MDLCCLSKYENNPLWPELPVPCCNFMACAVTGHRMAASPLHSHWTHAPPEWFWFFRWFVFVLFLLLFQSVDSLQCRKALTCQLI
uniref:Uncharacterized protein n=2 Tax=Equus asinus TaxID=9793 RepID=A0A9L0JSS3_EQUAS